MAQDQELIPISAVGAAVARKRPPKTRLNRLLERPESGVVIAAILVYLFFAVMAPHFFSERVAANILLASSALGIVAVGVATLMIAGQFDLSVGSVYGLSAAIFAYILMRTRFGNWLFATGGSPEAARGMASRQAACRSPPLL